MRPSNRDNFTIAIICALTFEAEAVEDLFDETYDRLGEYYGKQPRDDNAYVNGRIGKHNVVLCYMPGMGKGSAASVASSLKISYKRVEVALVVGICGGAPYPSSSREIFLGDVIISDSVVQYDFGRQYPGGFEKKTGVKDTLGRPNTAIRSKLAGLKARRSRKDLQEKLSRHLQTLQESLPDWFRPTVDDILFEASYEHKHYDLKTACLCLDSASEDICKAAINLTCTLLNCDLARVCRRRLPTEHSSPSVHIGTVASADTVMKSGEHRDRLVESEGVIGFEMEGAGVWDNISCIIIKGVCDYADSHKSKAWQAYAAATGAAAAKSFLEYWEPTAQEDLTDLMKRLDGLALAIVLAGAYMRETSTSIKEYLHFYKSCWSDLQSESEPIRQYWQGNILETWTITYQEIQKRDPAAAKLLLLLACFDNRDIWYELIQSASNCSDTPSWFDKTVSSKLVFKKKLKALIRFSLVETKQQEGSYTLHPVVQDWCFHIAASEEATNQLHEMTLISVGHMVPSSDDRDYARLEQRLLPHANFLMQKERHSWREDRLDICEAWNGLGNIYSDQGKLREAEEMYQRALAGKEKALGLDHTSTLRTVHNLGLLYSNQGKLQEAEEMYQRALAGTEKALEAEKMYQRALAGTERALGPDHTSTLDTVNNLGILYKNQGKLQEAKEMYQRALEGYKKALGPDHTSTLRTQALKGYKKALGPDHTSTLDTVHNIGFLYSNQSKLQEAEEMYQRALAGYEKALGPGHSKTRMVSESLAALTSLHAKRPRKRDTP
ncbi:hypothetical protein BJY01DRAFT_240744 [Aspergillus pseudoustus]|uniref:Nucleoside phosphorylase domain-containing protein n=1 Tax=Aspergillus pseudoustus TaxID=1810923 RepID=A0ABR4IMU0_9EURO